MKNTSKDILFVVIVTALMLQWIVIKNLGIHLPLPWLAIAPGIAIFGAAFMLSWGAELAQFEIPQSLAIAFLALVAVLPEYAVDMYFAWEAAINPEYIHYATANMTGANRLLIGLGWAVVGFAYFFKTKKKSIVLERTHRIEILALLAATLYSLVIPLKGTLTWVDSIFLVGIFIWYITKAIQCHHKEPEVEGPIEKVARWSRRSRNIVTIIFFALAGYSIYIAAEPFAEGLLLAGENWGIEKFILVQWLAPLASESPEFMIAIIFALRARGSTSLGTLISSKVNQWTLLVGMLPLVYCLSAGTIQPMGLDVRQAEEIFLTAAQSLFACIIIANLRFSFWEAFILFALFATQFYFTSPEARTLYAFAYIGLSILWLVSSKGSRDGIKALFTDGMRHPKNL